MWDYHFTFRRNESVDACIHTRHDRWILTTIIIFAFSESVYQIIADHLHEILLRTNFNLFFSAHRGHPLLKDEKNFAFYLFNYSEILPLLIFIFLTKVVQPFTDWGRTHQTQYFRSNFHYHDTVYRWLIYVGVSKCWFYAIYFFGGCSSHYWRCKMCCWILFASDFCTEFSWYGSSKLRDYSRPLTIVRLPSVVIKDTIFIYVYCSFMFAILLLLSW